VNGGRGLDAWVLFAYAALTVFVTFPLVLNVGHAIPGSGDAYVFYWNLWWVKRALIELRTNPFVSGDVYFPYGAPLYFHTLNVLQDVLALPIAVLAGLPAAYNVIVFAAFILSGYAMYRLALYIFVSEVDSAAAADPCARLAAFVAGAVFTFSSYRMARLLGHLDLLSTQWLLLFVLFLLKTLRERGWVNPILCAAFLGATTLTSWYYAAFALVFLTLALIRVVVVRRPDWRQPIARTAAAVAVFTILVSPLLIVMLTRGRLEGHTSNPAYDIDRFSADLLAFVVPSPLHPLSGRIVATVYRAVARNGSGIESIVFLGYVPLVLAAVAVIERRRTWTFWLAGCALFTALALGPAVHAGGRPLAALSAITPYRVFLRLPYGDIPRVPARFAVMTTMCLSIVAGGGAWIMLRRVASSHVIAVAALMTAAIVFENAAWPIPMASLDVPPRFERLASDPIPGAMIEVPIPNDPLAFPMRMLWQTVHRQPVYGGYLSRGLPPLAFEAVPGFAQFKSLTAGIDDVVPYDEPLPAATSRAVLSVYGAHRVVIEKSLMDPASIDLARELGDALLGLSARRTDDAFTLDYEIPTARDTVPPTLWLDTGWSYLERLPQSDGQGRGMRWRWMADHARFGIVTSASASVRLRVAAQSFRRGRRLRVALDGIELATWPVTTDRAMYETPAFSVASGACFVELSSIDGTESPGNDPRRLSIAVFRAELSTDRR